MKKKRRTKKVCRLIGFLGLIIGLYLIYIIMVVISQLTPHRLIDTNIILSAQKLTKEGLYVSPININNTAIKWDNYSTANAFNMIWHTNNNDPINGALINPMGIAEREGETVIDIMNDQISGAGFAGTNYSRYWGGSLILIRLLLIFGDLDYIRIWLLFMSIILFFADIISIQKYIGTVESLAFGLLYFTSGMFINVMCLTYFAEILVVQTTLLIICNISKNKLVPINISILFFIVGSFTMFFSWYSFPLITLCIPMVLLLTINNDKKMNFKEIIYNIGQLLLYSVSWCMGYICTILVKALWCIISGTEATATSHMSDLIGNMSIINRLNVIGLRITLFFNYQICFMSISSMIILIAYLILVEKRYFHINLPTTIGYIFIAIYPCVWQFIFAQHALIHGVEGYLYIISIFAFFALIIKCFVKAK